MLRGRQKLSHFEQPPLGATGEDHFSPKCVCQARPDSLGPFQWCFCLAKWILCVKQYTTFNVLKPVYILLCRAPTEDTWTKQKVWPLHTDFCRETPQPKQNLPMDTPPKQTPTHILTCRSHPDIMALELNLGKTLIWSKIAETGDLLAKIFVVDKLGSCPSPRD